MAHRVTVELDGNELAENWRETQKAYPILAGFSNPRIMPDSVIKINDQTPAGAVEVTIKIAVPPALVG